MNPRKVSDFFDHLSMIMEGPANAPANVLNYVGQKIVINALKKNDQLGGQTADVILSAAHFGATFEGRLTKTNFISIPSEVDSLVFGLAGLVSAILANDPPDPNYSTIVQPETLQEISTGDPVTDKIQADYNKYISLAGATLHAVERYQGAMIAHDSANAAMQSTAFQTFSAQSIAARSALTADDAELAQTLPSVDITTYPGGASAMAAVYHALCGQQLPNSFYQTLAPLLGSQSSIDQLVCNYVSNVTSDSISASVNQAKVLLSGSLP